MSFHSQKHILEDLVDPFLPYVPLCSVLAASVYTDVRYTGVKPTEAYLVSNKTRCSKLTRPGRKIQNNIEKNSIFIILLVYNLQVRQLPAIR